MKLDRSEDFETPERIAEWEARKKHFIELWRPRKIEEAERRERMNAGMIETKVMIEHGKRRHYE